MHRLPLAAPAALFAVALLAAALFATAPALAQFPLHVGGALADQANGVHYDDLGNAYVVGAFQGAADFDPGAGVLPLVSAGNTDAFIAAYDPGGNVLWAFPIRGPGRETANDVHVAGGVLYVTGYYEAGADFLGLVPPNAGSLDAYVAAYKISGGTPVLVWVAPISGPNDQIGESLDLHPFPPFNVWATGSFRSATNFGGLTLTPAGNTDVFVAGYDAGSGLLFDAFRVGGTGADAGLGLSLLRPNLPCVTGYFRGNVDFEPSAAVFNIASAGSDDGFVACYLDVTTGGATLFAPFNAFRIGGPGVDRGYDVDVNLGSSGSLVVNVTGGFSAAANFNGPVFASNGSLDAFVASYDISAVNQWVVPFGGPQLDVGQAIDGDACGNVVAAGGFRAGPVDFDPFVGGPSYLLPTFANYDAWTAGYDGSGNFRFANRIARNGVDVGYGVAVKPSGAHLAAGVFAQTPVFSSGTNISAASPFASYGSTDGYLAAYNVNGALRRSSCPAAPSGLEVWTDFDAFSGGLFLDLSAPATFPNDGAPVGGVVTAPGVVDLAAIFPTGGDAIVIPPDPSLALGTNDLTVDAWVQHDAVVVSNHLSIVSNLNSPVGDGYEVQLRRVNNTDWAIVVVFDDGVGGPTVLTSPQFPFPPSTWRFITATVDHTTTANFYVDGVFIGAAAGPPEGPVNFAGPMFMHRSVLVGGNDQPGWLDEVEVFHRILTPPEIALLYTAGKCKPCQTAPFQPTQRAAGGDAAPTPGVAALSAAPMVFALGQSSPNPTSGLTEVTFTLPAASAVSLRVFDVLGREVARLVDERREAGRHAATFDAGALPSGVYLYRFEAAGRVATRRLTVAR